MADEEAAVTWNAVTHQHFVQVPRGRLICCRTDAKSHRKLSIVDIYTHPGGIIVRHMLSARLVSS